MPSCSATHVVRNGANSSGTLTFLCRGCGRRFVADPQSGPVPQATRDLILRPLGERLAQRAIARVTGVARSWLQRFVNDLYRDESRWRVDPPPAAAAEKKRDLLTEADKLWSFVGSKADVQWVWVTLDADTRRVLVMVVGDRSEFTARCLWESLPAEYREQAMFATDFPPAYRAVIPDGRHAAAGKEAGRTKHVDRFWSTVRQLCARVVRKTLSFSKCLENHVEALWFFIHLYNEFRT